VRHFFANVARARRLRAALGFLRLRPTEPELQLLHRWLDTWSGVGLITVGVERHGMRLSLAHRGRRVVGDVHGRERAAGAAGLRRGTDAVASGAAGGVVGDGQGD
jgi:hypothetical protein